MGNNEQTAIRLLKDLVSLQNGAPLERDKEEYDVSYMALKMHDTDHEQDCECGDCADMQHETAVAYVNKTFNSYE